jgi:hypothetical protein
LAHGDVAGQGSKGDVAATQGDWVIEGLGVDAVVGDPVADGQRGHTRDEEVGRGGIESDAAENALDSVIVVVRVGAVGAGENYIVAHLRETGDSGPVGTNAPVIAGA